MRTFGLECFLPHSLDFEGSAVDTPARQKSPVFQSAAAKGAASVNRDLTAKENPQQCMPDDRVDMEKMRSCPYLAIPTSAVQIRQPHTASHCRYLLTLATAFSLSHS